MRHIPNSPVPAGYEKSLAAYLREQRRPVSRLCRLFTRISYALWSRFPGHLALICAVLVTTLLCVFATRARGVEIPDRVIAALVQVESGAKWHGIGEITGKWKTSKAGAFSHFQLTDIALRQMGVEHKADRIRRCPVLAESYARAFLIICYEKRGNWRDALATYNAWSRYRSSEAQDYAARVLNIAETL